MFEKYFFFLVREITTADFFCLRKTERETNQEPTMKKMYKEKKNRKFARRTLKVYIKMR